MEKAVLKTLIYADIFEYPLKFNEIHKWLIGKKATLRQIEKTIKSLEARVKSQGNYFFLKGRKELIGKRLRREKQSEKYLKKAKLISQALRIIPWIKLVGISGGLAINNVSKKDDIDLFFITSKNRMWVSRLLTLGLLSLIGQRRKRHDQGKKIAGKFCCNIWLEEDNLKQQNKDLYTAHEILQMKVLWERDGMYTNYLENNSWAFRFLPNWVGNQYQVLSSKYNVLKKNKASLNTKYIIHNTFLDKFEQLAKKIQLWYMKQPSGLERIEDNALYFHPEDLRQKILFIYKQRLKKIN